MEYTGSRSTGGDGLAGSGEWGNDFTLSWIITSLGGGNWNYKYTYAFTGGAISHLILDLTDDCIASQDCVTAVGPVPASPGNLIYGSFSGDSPSNPGMPGMIVGIKFDYAVGLALEFNSNRAPVWGDFYAKNGTVPRGGNPPSPFAGQANAIWNTGLLLENRQSSKILDFIARPNGQGVVPPQDIPEPSTYAMIAGGLGLLAFMRRRVK